MNRKTLQSMKIRETTMNRNHHSSPPVISADELPPKGIPMNEQLQTRRDWILHCTTTGLGLAGLAMLNPPALFAADDAETTAARFLDAAKYAGFAAVAEVKALPQDGDAAIPARLGIEWKDLLYAPEATRQAMAKVKALAVADARAAAELKIGDRILVVVDERTVHFRVRSDAGRALLTAWTEGALLVPWTQSRQDALQAALAPGWRDGDCPWCHREREGINGGIFTACRVCKANRVGLLCEACARQRGECTAWDGNCKRTIGPATRGVTFRLWAYDPNGGRNLPPRNECRIQAGAERLPLWVEVQNEKGETPEFQTPGGGKRFDCCKTLFYLVEGPGLAGPTPAFHGDGGAGSRMMGPYALQKGSATGRADLLAGTLFATPGTYTVRAVAGRLVSNPVKVIVEPETDAQRKAKQEAGAKAPIERKQQIDRERELKQRAIREGGP